MHLLPHSSQLLCILFCNNVTTFFTLPSHSPYGCRRKWHQPLVKARNDYCRSLALNRFIPHRILFCQKDRQSRIAASCNCNNHSLFHHLSVVFFPCSLFIILLHNPQFVKDFILYMLIAKSSIMLRQRERLSLSHRIVTHASLHKNSDLH